ncbi:hypothetical protein FB107DRAFT_275270 [Schizophyllum commune]
MRFMVLAALAAMAHAQYRPPTSPCANACIDQFCRPSIPPVLRYHCVCNTQTRMGIDICVQQTCPEQDKGEAAGQVKYYCGY